MGKSLIVTLLVAIVAAATVVPAAAQRGCYSMRCQIHHECPPGCK
jgi:hypothetical protein